MSTSEVKTPGPDHPITIEPHDGQVVVCAGDRIVADSEQALELNEAGYPVVLYVPLSDVDGTTLKRSDKTSHCPYKGEASYFDVCTDDGELENVAWCYEKPYDAVSEIRGLVAFYPDRVRIES